MITDEEGLAAHSEMGPSTAHRWRRCYGSVALSRGLPDTARIEAAYGTVFHYFAALCLELGLDPQGFVGDTYPVEGFGVLKFDQEMADNMLFALDFLWSMADSDTAIMIVEKRVGLQIWVGKGEFGTTDVAIFDPVNWRIIVFDWKYGAGVPVSPVRNDQAILYFLGSWNDFGYQIFHDYLLATTGDLAFEEAPWFEDIEVIVMIEQPRAQGGGGDWTTNVGELLSIGEQIKYDARMAKSPEGATMFNPGPEQCKFCKAAKANICAPRARMLLEEAGLDFDALEGDFTVNAEPELPRPRALSPEQRSQVLIHKGMIEKYLDDLHREAYDDAMKGRAVPGLKLVVGRSPPRKWVNEKRAEMLLRKRHGSAAFTRKLISPAGAEELEGKRSVALHYGKLIESGEGKPILVPDHDKRSAVPSYVDDFDLVEDDNLI